VVDPALATPAGKVREGDLIVVHGKHLLSAAIAALLFTATGSAQQSAPVTQVTLADALRRAQMVSPTVVNAQGSIRTAQLAVRSATWSLIPALTVSPQMSLSLSNGQSRLDPITGEIISGNVSTPTYQFGASASYTIFDGFARSYTLKQQHANEEGANASLVTSQYSSDYTTTDAFFTALADKQLVTVAQSAVDAAAAQLSLASAKLKAGSGQLSDSLSALGGFLQARLQLLQAQSNQIVAEANLGRLIGVAGRVAAVDDSAFYQAPPALDTAAIRQELMTTAPTLKADEASLTAAQLAWKASKAQYYPMLTANAAESWTGYWSSPSPPNSQSGLTARRSMNLQLSFTPWTSYAREAQVENNAIRISNAEAVLADQRNFLSAQLSQAYTALATAQESINVTAAAVAAGNEALRVVTERYRIGVATITDVLAAQNTAVTAQANQVTARYQYLRAKAQLEQTLGRRL
jgi:outer membrane protein